MKLKPSDSFIGTVRQKLQVGGFTEENIEEWAKSFWDAALLDTVRVENEDGTKNWGKTLEKAGLNLDDMVDTAICLLPLQLLTFGAGVGVARAEHRTFQIGFNRLYDSLQTEAERQMFDAIRTELNTSGNLNIESLREQIKQTLTADTPKHILETAKSENWNQQQIDEATVNYKKGRILMLIDSYQDNFTDTFRQSQREVINKAAEETANTISNNKDGGHIYEARYVGEDGKVRKAYITQGKIEGTENEDGTFTVTGGSQRFGVVANGANGLAFREGAVTLSQLKEGTVVRLSNEKMIEMLTAQKLANVNQERTFVYDGNVYDTQSGILLGEEGSFDRTDSYSVNEEIRIKTPGGKYTQVHLVGDNITLREDGSINFELSPDLRVLVNGRLVDITNPEMQASINESLRAGYTRKKTGQGYYLQLHRHRGSETQVRYKENRGKLIQSLQDTENVEDEEEITMPVLQSKKNVPFKITLPSSGKIVSVNVVGDLTYKEDGTIDWANSTDAVIYVSDGKGSKAISGMRLEGTLDKFHQEQQKQRGEYEQAINVYREEQLAKYKARVERAEARARRRVDKRNALERIETIRQELQAKIDEDVKTTEEEVMHLREHQKPHPDRTYTFWNSHDKRITINGHPTNIRVTFPKNGVLSQYPSGAIRWDSAYSSSEVPIIEVMHYNQETKKNEWVALDTTTPNIEAQVRGLLDIKFMEQRMDAIEKNRIREANLQTKREEAEERKRKFKEEREALNNDAVAKAKAKQKDGKTLNIFETLLCMKDSDTTTTAATMLNDLIKATQFELEETKQTVTSESIKKQIKLAGELKAYTDFQQQYFPNSEQVEAQEEADTQAAIQEIVTEGGIEAEETTEIGAEEEIEMEDVEITLNDIEEDNKEIVVEEEEEQQSKEVKDERVGHFVDTDLDITSEDVDILYDGKGFKKGHIRIARKGEGTTKTWQPLKRFPMALYNGEQCVVLSKGDALSNRKNVSILMVDSKEVLNNIPLGRLEAIDSTQENPKPYFTEVQTNSQKTMSAINSIDTIDGLLNYTLFKLGDKKYSLFDIINVRSGKDMYKRLMGEVRGYIERTYPESKDKQDERYKAVRDDLKYNLDKIAKRWNIFVAESGVEAALLEEIDSELLMDNYEDMSIKDFLPKKYNETFEEYIDRLRGIVEQAGGSVSPMRINEAFSNINKESTGNAILSRVRQAFLLVQYLKELGHDISLSSSLEYEQAESEASIARQYEQQAGRGVEADQQEKPFISPAQQRAGQTLIDILKDSGIDTQVLNDAELDAVIEANPTGTPLTFSNGEVYGVRIGNVLYVSGERMNADTATHEYTHLWLYLLEMDSPKEVEKIIKTLKGSNTWNSVVRNPAFVSKSDAAIASEVLARLTGQYWGAEVNGKVRIEVAIEEATRPTEEQNGLLKAIRNFWKWVMKKFEALSYIGNSVAKQDNAIQELVNRPIIDLLSRRNMKERLDERAMELAAEHNVPIVILHNLEEARNTQGIPADVIQGLESGEIAQGFMLPEDETQTVYIYMPFNTSLSDLEKTFAHEAMGHISLREFFGAERYDAVMIELYNQMSDKDKRMIQDRDKRFATADDETRQAIIAREMDEWLAENRESWKRVPIVSQAHDMLLPLFKKLGIWAEFSHHDLGKMFASSGKAFMTEERKAQRAAQIAAAQEQQASDARFRSVKHGTGYIFDRFDHSKMGTGEGAQAYGWGTYLTDVDGIARTYAESTGAHMYKKERDAISWKTKKDYQEDLDEWLKWQKSLIEENKHIENNYDVSKLEAYRTERNIAHYNVAMMSADDNKKRDIVLDMEASIMAAASNDYDNLHSSDRYNIQDVHNGLEVYYKHAEENGMLNEEFEKIFNEAKSYFETIADSRWIDTYEANLGHLEYVNIKIKELQEQISNAPFAPELTRVVYDVEIPDPNGFNYLQWDENLTSRQAYAIRDALYDTILENDEDMMYYTSFEQKHLRQDIDMTFTDRIDGKTAYGTIQDYLGSPEAASKFLDSIGIIGMQYPAQFTTGGRSDGASNFVIYNENNAEIVDSVRFRKITNDKFNNELQQQIDGTLPEGHIYDLGMPSAILRSTNIPNMPIEMSSTVLKKHSEDSKHPFDLNDIKDLVYAIEKPLAIFKYGDETKAQNLILEIQQGDKNYLVGIHFNQEHRGLVVSDIRGIFPKDNAEWLNWVNQGKLLYVDKERTQALIDKQRKTLAEVEYLDLDSVAKVIQNFENPKLNDEKNADIIRFNTPEEGVGGTREFDSEEVIRPLSEQSETTDGDTRYRSLGRFSQDDTTRSLRFNGADRAIESFADRTHSVRIMQDDITKYLESNGFFDGMSERQRLDMLDTLDVATVIENIESAVEFEFSRYRDTLGKGLNDAVEQMSRLISKSGLNFIDPQGEKINSINVLKLYMIAKDNLEREDAVGMKEFILPTRGLQAFINETNTTWEGFVAQFESAIPAADIQNLWEQVKSVRKFTLDNLLGSGIITQEQYNDYITSDFYVPERGFMDEDIRKEYESKNLFGGSKKKGVDSKVNIKAKGGESLAGDVIESLHLLAADAINKSAQNKMRQKLFDILTNPNLERWREQLGIKTPVEMRLAYNPRTDKFVEVGRDLTLNEQKAVNKKLAELRSDLAAKTQQRNAYIRDYVIAERNGANDIVEERREQIEKLNEEISDIQTQLAGIGTNEVDKSKGNERVDVYLNGIKHHMYMPNAHIADAINGVMYESGNVVKRVQSFTRTFANWLTTYNATFSVTNIQRDVARISAAGITEYGIKFEGKFIANFASPKLTRALGKYITTGEIDTNTEIGYYLEEFFKIGAHTGFTTLTRMEDLRKEIQSLSSESQRSVGKKLAKGTQKFLQLDKNSVLWRSAAAINTYAEYLTRFAAYMTVRDMGYSALEASRAAKNLSVNFNRKGKGNVLLSLTNMMIPFTNAAIQGATGYMRHFGGNNHTKNGVAATRALTFMTLIPMALGYMSYLLDPDDDEQEYLVPQYERENYFTLPLGIRWAYDEQLGAFSAIGANIAKWQKGYMTDSEFWSSNISLLSKRLLPAPSSIGESVESLIKIASGESDKTFSQVVSSLISIGFGGNILSVANNRTNFGGKVRTGIDGFAEYNASENAPLVYRDMAKWWAEFQGMDTEVGSILIKDDSVESGIREASDMENVNPREIETMLGYAPSAVMESIETAHAIARFIASDDPNKEEEFKKFWTGDSKFLNPKSVPLLNRLYKAHGTTEYQMIVKSESKKLAKKLNRHYNDWKKRQGLNATEEYTANEILKLEGYPTADSMDEVVRNATAYAELNYMIKAYENIEDAEKASEDINVMLDNIKLKRELIQAMRFYLSNEDKLYERAANNILNARDELGFRPVTPNAIDPYFDKDEEGKTMFQKRNEKREAEEEPETRAGKRLRSIKESF